MKTTAMTAARLVSALALAAGLWACSNNAGDEPVPPTGPGTEYNPETDTPGARIRVAATPDSVAPGEEFDLVSVFTNADGQPVDGVPLTAEADAGGAVDPNASAGCFTFFTNPTLTDAGGHASIGVRVSSDCPNESYTFKVSSTSPGPRAHGIASIHVRGTGPESITVPSTPVGNTAPPFDTFITYRAEGSENNLGHAIEYKFFWGDGSDSGWVPADSSGEATSAQKYDATDVPCGAVTGTLHSVSATFEITTKARCATDTTVLSPTSPALKVTVTRPNCP